MPATRPATIAALRELTLILATVTQDLRGRVSARRDTTLAPAITILTTVTHSYLKRCAARVR
jgi:hypothetical protein